VTDEAGDALPFTVGEAVADKGAPVTVTIGEARRIAIAYTASDAEALQWLAPEQTAGGEHPYLFSQGQPTLNRTWIPTQDSPGIRQTWEARIVAPKPLTVVMSGLRVGEVANSLNLVSLDTNICPDGRCAAAVHHVTVFDQYIKHCCFLSLHDWVFVHNCITCRLFFL